LERIELGRKNTRKISISCCKIVDSPISLVCYL
jgi:hypothetical protein